MNHYHVAQLVCQSPQCRRLQEGFIVCGTPMEMVEKLPCMYCKHRGMMIVRYDKSRKYPIEKIEDNGDIIVDGKPIAQTMTKEDRKKHYG